MARVCLRCGAEHQEEAHFCGACGAALASAPSGVDPYAQTLQPDDAAGLSAVARSLMAKPGAHNSQHALPAANAPAPAQNRQDTQSAAVARQGTVQLSARTPAAPAAPPRELPLAAGSRVQVRWADGQLYPGTVLQGMPGRCLVQLSEGPPRWIETRWLMPLS